MIFIISLIIIFGNVSYAEESYELNNNQNVINKENDNEKMDNVSYDENEDLNDDIDIEDNEIKERNSDNVGNNIVENNKKLDSTDKMNSNF